MIVRWVWHSPVGGCVANDAERTFGALCASLEPTTTLILWINTLEAIILHARRLVHIFQHYKHAIAWKFAQTLLPKPYHVPTGVDDSLQCRVFKDTKKMMPWNALCVYIPR
jgi:hypothetical protein